MDMRIEIDLDGDNVITLGDLARFVDTARWGRATDSEDLELIRNEHDELTGFYLYISAPD